MNHDLTSAWLKHPHLERFRICCLNVSSLCRPIFLLCFHFLTLLACVSNVHHSPTFTNSRRICSTLAPKLILRKRGRPADNGHTFILLFLKLERSVHAQRPWGDGQTITLSRPGSAIPTGAPYGHCLDGGLSQRYFSSGMEQPGKNPSRMTWGLPHLFNVRGCASAYL